MEKRNGTTIPLSEFMTTSGVELNYNMPSEDYALIQKIVERLYQMMREFDPIRAASAELAEMNKFSIAMDIATVHCNDRRIKLLQLLMSDATDFRSDLLHIYLRLDRRTGKLPTEISLLFEEKRL